MLERLVAGILVIAALLWAASTLATPDAPPDVRDEADLAPPDDPARPPADPPLERDGSRDEPTAPDDEDAAEPEPAPRKGKKHPGDA